MNEILSLQPELLAALTFFLLLTVTIVTLAGMKTWRKHQATKIDAELKMEMIARGMSADDIERILTTKSSDGGRLASTQHFANR